MKKKANDYEYVISYPDVDNVMVSVGIKSLPDLVLFGHNLLKGVKKGESLDYYVVTREQFVQLKPFEIDYIFYPI